MARAIDAVPPLPPPDALAGSTVFFVPFAGVTPMFSQACVVARTLKERGHRVFVTRCFRLFDRCPAMENDRLPFDAGEDLKRESCLRCANNSLQMLSAYGLEPLDLRALVTPDMLARLDAALADAPRDDLLNFTYNGLPFGTLSAMDVVLSRKISNWSRMKDDERRAWMDYLRSCLLSYLLVDRLCREFHVRGIVHSHDYSLLLGARVAAQQNGVPCHGLAFPGHCNVDLRRYLILPTVWRPSSFKLLAQWPACRDLALEPARVRDVADDLIVRLRGVGSHIYSPAKSQEQSDVRIGLGLAKNRKTLVAYTSSLDELIATRIGMEALGIRIPDRPQPFADQIEWLKALVDCVEHSDDLQLVVRIHPREGVNKRESVQSQHLAMLREAFGGDFEHCRVVWPEDPTSSYDLGEAADLVLVSWSTIGLEMARLGVPVLVAFNGAASAIAHDDFLEWAPTPAEYFDKLRALLDGAPALDRIARAFRFYSLITLGTTLDLGDVVPASTFAGLPPYKTPQEAAAIEQIILGGKHVCDLNVERLHNQPAGLRDRETDALRRQLRRLVHFLMTGADPAEDVPLRLVSLAEQAAPVRDGGRVLCIDGFGAEYREGGRTWRRYSPMAVRLAQVSAAPVGETALAGARS